jgi:hypothetical protein
MQSEFCVGCLDYPCCECDDDTEIFDCDYKVTNKEGIMKGNHVKKVLCLLLFTLMIILLSGCGSPKVIDGKKYDTYGLLNESSMRNDKIEYRVIVGNVILGAFLCETIIAPVYFFGFDMYEPIGKKGEITKGEVIK